MTNDDDGGAARGRRRRASSPRGGNFGSALQAAHRAVEPHSDRSKNKCEVGNHVKIYVAIVLLFCVSFFLRIQHLMKANYTANELVESATPSLSTGNELEVESATPSLSTGGASRRHDGTLPSCEELMRQPGSIFSDGSFLTHKNTSVAWRRRRDGSGELTLPSTCQLKRYTALEAGQCLREKSVLFVGDSITRYQYFSFAYFLEYKQWPPRFKYAVRCHHVDEHGNTTCSKRGEPNVCWQDEQWGGGCCWDAYRKMIPRIGGGTDGDIYHGRMESQSVRAFPTAEDPNPNPNSIENMQYVSSAEDGHTQLSYAMEKGYAGTEHFSGWNFTGCARTASCRVPSQKYERYVERYRANDFDWSYSSIAAAFQDASFREQHRGTNYAIYNRGLWGQLQEEKAEKMMTALHDMIGGNNTQNSNRCFYRSTTGCNKSKEGHIKSAEYGHVRNASYAAGCEYFDMAVLTEEFRLLFGSASKSQFGKADTFVDDGLDHYQPWVYEELSNALLNVLCNVPEKA